MMKACSGADGKGQCELKPAGSGEEGQSLSGTAESNRAKCVYALRTPSFRTNGLLKIQCPVIRPALHANKNNFVVS